jgi:hypothetical protein
MSEIAAITVMLIISRIGIISVALIVDDTSESSHIIKIRPRLSWHGGAESLVLEPGK